MWRMSSSSASWPQTRAARGADCGHLAGRHNIRVRGNANATEPGRLRGRLRRGDRRRPGAPGAHPGAGDPAHAGAPPRAHQEAGLAAVLAGAAHAHRDGRHRDDRDVRDAVLRDGLVTSPKASSTKSTRLAGETPIRSPSGFEPYLSFDDSFFSASSTSARAEAPAATFSCWISR